MPEQSRFHVLIELYDHTQRSPSFSPLLPPTSSALPPAFDAQLRASSGRLVLPQTGNLWSCHLPRTRKLDTRLPSTLRAAGSSSVTSTREERPAPRIWSESFGLPSPPSIATANLWSPSKPSPSSTSPPQQAVLDYRFGPIEIDSVSYPTPRMPSAVGGIVSPQMANRTLPGQQQVERPAESSGTSELYWGTIHLYREAGAEESSNEEKAKAKDEDDGRSMGLIAVPGLLNAAALLSFIAPALESIEQVKMLRDATPNRSLVLLRFRDTSSAAEFRRMYNGKPYHDSKDSEICHVVAISSVKLKASSTPPFTFPYAPSDLTAAAEAKDLVELPTCPVCLDVLDSRYTGLVQIPCSHEYHAHCLLRWGDSRCPVCRSTNARTRRNTITAETTDNKCAVCQSPSNLWICVVCGNVGCGRYQGGHAHSHFGESGHSYSLEIETGRIWSYFDDEYVHRLIRLRSNPADPTSPTGDRLIELPSLSLSSRPSHSDPDDLSSKIGAAAGGPDRSAEVEQDKLEALALEFSSLMSGQMQEQREYYEEELSRSKSLKKLGDAKRDELDQELERLRKDKVEAEKREKERVTSWKKVRVELEARVEQLSRDAKHEADERKKERSEALKARKALEKELEAERAVTASLTANLSSLRSDLAAQQRETMEVRGEVEDLRETMNDLMAALSMRDKIEQDPNSEMAGASIGVAPAPGVRQDGQARESPSKAAAAKRKKKKKPASASTATEPAPPPS